jgi:hypothetical protein
MLLVICPGAVFVVVALPGLVIVPFETLFVFPVTVPMPTTPLIVAVFFTKTLNPSVSKTLPRGTVKLL